MQAAHDTSKKLAALTARKILAIAANEPERLFTGERAAVKAEFRALSKLWHPDLNHAPEAKDVFEHISALRVKAEEKLDNGIWLTPGEVRLKDLSGHEYALKFVKQHSFELGEFYISKNSVTYVVHKNAGFDDLANNALPVIKSLKYADDKLRKEFEARMPAPIKTFETANAHVFMFKKDPDMVLLSDLRDYILKSTGTHLDSKHVAWVMSRLHSLTCFLQVNKLTHNAISADTVFVSPAMHTASLLGGWWYAAREATALKGLPGHALNSVPAALLADGKASRRIDLELIRAVGRDLCGDPTGSLILRDPTVPKAVAHWLTNSSSGNAIADFKEWSEKILKSSFGARRFTVLNVSFSDVYQPS